MQMPISDPRPTVFVVDDDASVRDAVSNLLESVGLCVRALSSTEQFLQAQRPEAPCCLVLDVMLPGMNGLEFQQILEARGVSIPVIFITAHGDISMTSRAMKAGAIEFLAKPFQKKDLIAAIHQGLERDGARRAIQADISAVRSRFEGLTQRERQVMDLVVSGMPNKGIAGILGISEVTVKMHRGRVMQKMEAASLADLVRMADRIKVPPAG
jgi:FixJ family two-component response regulator